MKKKNEEFYSKKERKRKERMERSNNIERKKNSEDAQMFVCYGQHFRLENRLTEPT